MLQENSNFQSQEVKLSEVNKQKNHMNEYNKYRNRPWCSWFHVSWRWLTELNSVDGCLLLLVQLARYLALVALEQWRKQDGPESALRWCVEAVNAMVPGSSSRAPPSSSAAAGASDEWFKPTPTWSHTWPSRASKAGNEPRAWGDREAKGTWSCTAEDARSEKGRRGEPDLRHWLAHSRGEEDGETAGKGARGENAVGNRGLGRGRQRWVMERIRHSAKGCDSSTRCESTARNSVGTAHDGQNYRFNLIWYGTTDA